MNNAKATCDVSENEGNSCKETLKTLLQEKKKNKVGTTSSDRKWKISKKATDHDALERINEEIIDARVESKLVKKRHIEPEKTKKNKAVDEFNAWTNEFPYITKESLIEHAK